MTLKYKVGDKVVCSGEACEVVEVAPSSLTMNYRLRFPNGCILWVDNSEVETDTTLEELADELGVTVKGTMYQWKDAEGATHWFDSNDQHTIDVLDKILVAAMLLKRDLEAEDAKE